MADLHSSRASSPNLGEGVNLHREIQSPVEARSLGNRGISVMTPLDSASTNGDLHRLTCQLALHGALSPEPSYPLRPSTLERIAAELPSFMKGPLFRISALGAITATGAIAGSVAAILTTGTEISLAIPALAGSFAGFLCAHSCGWILTNESSKTGYRQTKRDGFGAISLHFDRGMGRLKEQATHPTMVHVEETFRVLKEILDQSAPGQRFHGIQRVRSESPIFLKIKDGEPILRDAYKVLVDRLQPEQSVVPLSLGKKLSQMAAKLISPGWTMPQQQSELRMEWRIETEQQRAALSERISPILDALDLIDSFRNLSDRTRTDLKGRFLFEGAPDLRAFLGREKLLPNRSNTLESGA